MGFIGKRQGYKHNQKVYVVGLARYGNIKQYLDGMFRVKMMRGEPSEIWVKPHEIEDGR